MAATCILESTNSLLSVSLTDRSKSTVSLIGVSESGTAAIRLLTSLRASPERATPRVIACASSSVPLSSATQSE